MTAAASWVPSDDFCAATRIGRFLRRLGLADRQALLRRSIDDPAWFWRAVVEDLPVEFYTPFDTVVDASRGRAHARWFVGGTVNVAHNCLDRHARSGRAASTAVIWESEDGATRTLSYAELLAETNRFANALKRLGIAQGDRVGLYLPMTPEAVLAFLACAKIGAVAVPIFSGFGAPAVATRLQDCDARVLVTADGTLRRGRVVPMKAVADEAAALSPSVRHVVVLRRVGGDVPWKAGRDLWWHELVAREPDECATEALDAETPFLIAYTSGTTGRPKGAVHVHGGFLVKIAQEAAYQIDMGPDDTLFWLTDLGWIMGPWEIVGALANGGAVMLYEGAPDYPEPDRLWRLVERHRPTILGVSPTLVRALMKHGTQPVRGHDLTSLRILASTGEPWNPAPWQWYFEHVGGGRCPVINFSGGTEVGACLLSPLPIQPLKPCSVGGPALGMAVEVFDADGKPLRGGVGELVCTNLWPGMTRGLWNDDGRYERTYWSRWPGVWVHGDWASVDADGEWFLHGRSDDTLNVAGKRIGPAEIESAAVAHPAVSEAAAIGVPHAVKGEAICCFVVLRPGFECGDALAAEIGAVVSDRLGKSFAPEAVHFVTDLPRTRSAKIVRRAIRAALLGQDPGDLTTLENPDALAAIARFR